MKYSVSLLCSLTLVAVLTAMASAQDPAAEGGEQPAAAAAPPAGAMDVNRRFQSVENLTLGQPKEAPIERLSRASRPPAERDMPAYPAPPVFGSLIPPQVALPPSREPSWIRQQRLMARLLPPPPRATRTRVVRPQQGTPAKFVRVKDAQHLIVRQGHTLKTVTLWAVAPTTRAGNQAAVKTLKSLLMGKNVNIFPAGQAGASWVFVGKQCVNRELIARGLAGVQPKAAAAEPKLAALESSARKAKRGVWAKS